MSNQPGNSNGENELYNEPDDTISDIIGLPVLIFREAIDIASALVTVLDRDGHILYFNRYSEKMTGYRFDEIRGKMLWDILILPEEKEGVMKAFLQLRAGDFPNKYENYWRTKDGSKILIAWSNTAVIDDLGNVSHVIGTGIDITESRQKELELMESEEKFRTAFEYAGIGKVLIGPDGSWMNTNKAFRTMLGYSENELEEICFQDIIHPDSMGIFKSAADNLFSGKIDSEHLELCFVMKNETTIWGLLSMAVLRDEKRSPINLIIQIQDITKLTKLEDEMASRAVELEKINQQLRKEISEGKRRELVISQQGQEILELSTPVIKIWNGIVIAPLIGTLDSERTGLFMERLLTTIVKTVSPIAIIDITGVPTVDTQTAQHIIDAINAVKLLGSRVIISGISPSIAQTLVHLGIDLSGIITKTALADALKTALDILGFEISRKQNQTRGE